MQCPTCKSDNVQKLQMIYEGGTQKIDTTSRHSGVGYSARGGLMAGGGTTNTTGQAQSLSAKKAAPPAKRPYRTAVLAIVGGLLLIAFTHSAWFFIGILALGIGAFLVYRAWRYNTGPWPGLYDAWTHSWQCNKCGNVYAA